MANGDRQYDPVAGAAQAAIRTTNRTTRELQRRMGAPELPAQSAMYKNIRSGVQTVSQFSPFNIYGNRKIPGIGSLDQMGPDAELTNGFSPEDVIPGNAAQFMPGGENFPDPMGVFDEESPVPTPPPNGNGGKGSRNGSRNSGGGGNNGQLGEQSGQFSGVQ
jgi:hypothetical protein